ncbi:hypothetical protein [Seonamhaeicola aphaedonensis]|uniref:Uncharacterized protein n=1 Tax=Seonamhaeicola aphaedonensis TaxID=1461338 RepID=A0A3D9H809_9FLAO|nr:hypothetical protein [Seonamhaeicola aphaedonensis]RED45633.1 hypothetical protein DFQ02_10811 [Seonamhaeicola aphaedonensis]
MKFYLALFFTIMCSFSNGQVATLDEIPSVDGYIYINIEKKSLVIIDRIFSNVKLNEEKIIVNDTNSSILQNFSINESDKYKYYLVDYFESDESGLFSKNIKTIITEQKIELESPWAILKLSKMDLSNEYDWNCNDGKVNKVLRLKNDMKFLFEKRKEKLHFKLAINCEDFIFNQEVVKNNPKISIVDEELIFFHNDKVLYILSIAK